MKQVTLVDNRDGSPADVTVHMTYDGVRYTWDLSNANHEKLLKALAPWLACAEEDATPVEVKVKKSRATRSSTNGHSRDLRAWALENGFQVSSRGRISAEVQAAYDEAHA